LRKLSRRSKAEYTPPPSNASCRSQRSHARLRAYALERSSPSSLKKPTSCGSTTESTSLLQLNHATTKLLVAAPTTIPTVLELTSQPSPTVVAPTPADLHSKITATEKLSPTALWPVAVATIRRRRQRRQQLQPWGQQESWRRRQSRRPRPREQPRLRRLSRRVRRSPED
jgi:hypothetical protein